MTLRLNIQLILGFCGFVLIYSSCKTSPSGLVMHEIELSNQLGKMSILLPSEFDTLYTWVNFSDCDCCDIKMYRFASSNYSLLKETGMFHARIPDSLFQFTIFHKAKRNCEDHWKITQSSVDSLASLMEAKYEEAFVGRDSITWLNKEMLIIDNQTFVLLAYKSKSAYPFRMPGIPVMLEATTVIDGEVLNFVCECSRSNCEGFVEKMTKSLKSIHFR